LSAPTRCKNRRGDAGFTLLEVLIALAVVAVSLTAIGSLMAATVRSTRSLDQHLGLVETARAIETGLPGRDDLTVGKVLSGEMSGYRWRVEVLAFQINFVDPQLVAPWLPQAVRITVQSPAGQTLRIDTVRLARNAVSKNEPGLSGTSPSSAPGLSAAGISMSK
jgi:general secretion pathway protein I